MGDDLSVLVKSLDTETICDFEVPSKMKRIWNVELNNLVVFQNICQKYGLTYYAVAGTLLGAIRHKGFIPWDDDIDVGMPRRDYEIFLEVASKEIKSPLFLQTFLTERSFSMDMAKLRNSDTTGYTETEGLNNTNKGIFIDIFPIDHEPDDDQLRIKENTKHQKQFHLISACSKVGNYKGFKGILINIIRRFMCRIVTQRMKEHMMQKIIADISKYNGEDTQYCGLRSFWASDRFRWKNEDCKTTTEVPFEQIKIAVPVGYDAVLKNSYGDYRVFVRGASFHEGTTFEPDTPYLEYCGKLN